MRVRACLLSFVCVCVLFVCVCRLVFVYGCLLVLLCVCVPRVVWVGASMGGGGVGLGLIGLRLTQRALSTYMVECKVF